MTKRMKAAMFHVRLLQKRVESASECRFNKRLVAVVGDIAVVPFSFLRQHITEDLECKLTDGDDCHRTFGLGAALYCVYAARCSAARLALLMEKNRNKKVRKLKIIRIRPIQDIVCPHEKQANSQERSVPVIRMYGFFSASSHFKTESISSRRRPTQPPVPPLLQCRKMAQPRSGTTSGGRLNSITQAQAYWVG